MSQISHISPFDGIRHEDERGKEYWSARELGKLLGYGEYRKFKNAIEKAEEACKNSDQAVADHLLRVQEVIWNAFPAFFTGYLCFVNSPREVGILTVAQKPR